MSIEAKYPELIALLEKELDSASAEDCDEAIHPELQSLTFSVLGELKESLDISDLERRLHPYKDVDLSRLEEVIRDFDRIQTDGQFLVITSPSGATLDAVKELDLLKEHVSVLKEKGRELGETEIALRLELLLNTLVENILLCIPAENLALTHIQEIISSRFSLFSDDDVMRYWAAVQREFSSEHDNTGFVIDDDARAFLTVANVCEVREKLSYYLARLRPELAKKALNQQRTVYFQPLLGVAKLLTARDRSSLEPITHDEVNVLRVTSKIVKLWWDCFCREKSELVQFLGVAKDGFIATGESPKASSDSWPYGSKGKEKYLLIQLAKVLKYIDLLGRQMSHIEKSLWAYKLGLEVTLPESRTPIDRQREEYIQRTLCKFLIERDIQAFGTKFGRHQIDLLLQRAGEQYVIETKKYKGRGGARRIKKDLVQLQTYMSQQFAAPRGVLVIYNLTDTVISAPLTWISGRYLILPINLGRRTPSQVDSSIQVEAVSGEHLIHCSEVRATPTNTRKIRQRTKRKAR